ncbi:MAG: tetratricopeptide repeat protein [candidate division Zixibacteria bacterium]|nr:tetratricopeptide repeat protein [candidate division Zixibacteria bacterium]MBU1469619.1 tetratricopeptide repeat protein [candidate division Zixibacteria bacterium]MBU2625498.1 tetratricopeptide repeat protein [candidate division Zixibacteria bacterium]
MKDELMGNTKKKQRKTTRRKKTESPRNRKSAEIGPNTAYSEIIDKAQMSLDRGEFASAETNAESLLTKEVRDTAQSAYVFALRLAAFAAANQHKFELAKNRSMEALRFDNEMLDFHYLLSYVCGELDEHELVVVYAQRYLDIHHNIESGKHQELPFAGTYDSIHEVLNGIAVSLREQRKLQEAIKYFEQAIQIKPQFAVAYINLARLADQQGQRDDALRIIDKGIVACPGVGELKMLRDSISASRPSVSLCMIVKNEEKMLPRALKSVQGVVDEIVVVDTGSTDKTVEIAESFGAKVFHHEWERDFSKARNQSLSYASREWIFILDADEELVRDDIPLLKEMLQQKGNDLISVSVFNVSDDEGHASFLPSIRFFRRSVGAYYDGIVHNQLKFDEKQYVVLRGGVKIKHYGYGLSQEEMKKKVRRSRELLIKQLEDEPNDPFANMNLAQLYRGESATPSAEQCDKIILHAQRVIDNTDPSSADRGHLHLMALHQLASAYFFKAEYDTAREQCLKALEYKADYLDPIITLGYICSQTGKWSEARQWYESYLRARREFKDANETQSIILLNYKSEQNALYGIAEAYECEGNTDEAILWYEKVQKVRECYLTSCLRLAQLYFNKEDYVSAIKCATRHLKENQSAWPAHFILGESCRIVGRTAEAEQHLAAAVEMCEDSRDILHALLKLYFYTDRLAEANSIVDRLLSKFPDFTYPACLMGDVKYAVGEYAAAIERYEKCGDAGERDAQTWNNLGNSYFRLEQFAKAEQCYRRALAIAPEMAHANRNLGVSLAKSGRTGEAAEVLSSFLELAPDDFAVAHLLGDIMFEKGEFDSALKMYELCVTLAPSSFVVITKLADIYSKQGFIDSARLGYHQALQINPNYDPARKSLEALEGETARST